MTYDILLVEDQKEIRDIVSKYIVKEGYNVNVAEDGFRALEIFNEKDIHLVILDIMMPGISGFEVLQEIRKISEVPIIMLTAKQEEVDKINGFNLGADDYVIKPFSVREVMSRIKVLLRRIYKENDDIILKCCNLQLHCKSRKLYKNFKEVEITSGEFNVLKVLFGNIGQVLTREQIINMVHGYNYEGENRSIDSHIKRIRQKIEDDSKKPKILITKYGAGYIFGGIK